MHGSGFRNALQSAGLKVSSLEKRADEVSWLKAGRAPNAPVLSKMTEDPACPRGSSYYPVSLIFPAGALRWHNFFAGAHDIGSIIPKP